MIPTLDLSYFSTLADDHREWLAAFDARHLKMWERMLQDDIEAALCEAGVRRRLMACGIVVEPNEGLSGTCGGPDFRCLSERGHFFVEVTCIHVMTANEKFGLEDAETREFKPVKVMGMAKAVLSECRGKARQCADLDGPALVAVGTFHSAAGAWGFDKILANFILTGEAQLAWDVDTSSGQQIGSTYQISQLKSASFLRPDATQPIAYARSSISGLLLCNLATVHDECIGLLHPNPARPFAPHHLPGIEFGAVEVDSMSTSLQLRWSTADGSPEPNCA